ncbi:hypothetical protein MHBO_000299 [Bonamia ostreae]|uniref:Uncharacterized protein n=1 Tax=Bonamia ostreae TaxID=126728 RepID=A0ABV2AF45_9EUKA
MKIGTGLNCTEKSPRTQILGGNDWSNGLFGCFDDPMLCFMSCCVPCLPEARIYTKIRDDDNLILYTCVFCFIDLIGCFTCATCFLRTQVRKNYSIEGNMVFDFFISCCCMCCAIVQMHSQAE